MKPRFVYIRVVGTMEFDADRPLICLDHNALEICWNAGACFAITLPT